MRADRKIQNRAIQRFVKNNTRKNKARNVILVIAVVLVTIPVPVFLPVLGWCNSGFILE